MSKAGVLILFVLLLQDCAGRQAVIFEEISPRAFAERVGAFQRHGGAGDYAYDTRGFQLGELPLKAEFTKIKLARAVDTLVVSGFVRDWETEEPLPFVVVSIGAVDTANGIATVQSASYTRTDKAGNFHLTSSISKGDVLLFSLLGYTAIVYSLDGLLSQDETPYR